MATLLDGVSAEEWVDPHAGFQAGAEILELLPAMARLLDSMTVCQSGHEYRISRAVAGC